MTVSAIHPEEKRELLAQDTLKAWREYQDTGLHLTGQEVEKWLATWGTEDEPQAPACHQ